MYYPTFRLKGKVPILSAKVIDIIAERFILDFNPKLLEEPVPIDIEEFLEFYLQLEMEFDDLSSDQSCLGMTVFNNTSRILAYDKLMGKAKYISASEGTIIIDNSLLERGQEKRLRFTLGHEAGHWVFHKAFYGYNPGQLTLFEYDTAFTRCRSINSNYIYKQTSNWDSEKWMEWQADKFSASLLMPEQMVRECFSDRTEEVTDAVDRISSTFNVSKQAAYYRLCDLQILKPRDKVDSNNQLSLFE